MKMKYSGKGAAKASHGKSGNEGGGSYKHVPTDGGAGKAFNSSKSGCSHGLEGKMKHNRTA